MAERVRSWWTSNPAHTRGVHDPMLRESALTFPPRPDGEPSYNEGYVFDGERMLPATVVKAPFLSRLTPIGEDTSLVLRTADGDIEIEGENTFSTFLAPGQNVEFAPPLHQAGCRYRWDGEETYGMMERSIPVDQLLD